MPIGIEKDSRPPLPLHPRLATTQLPSDTGLWLTPTRTFTVSDKLGIDLIAAANAKIELYAAKYPVDKARGSSKKYTEL